jgi:hypothetical protein
MISLLAYQRMWDARVSAPLRQDIRSNAYEINLMTSIQKGIQIYHDKMLLALRSAEMSGRGSGHTRKVKITKVYHACRNLVQKMSSINIGQLPFGLAIGMCLKELGPGSRNRFLKVSSRLTIGRVTLFRLWLDSYPAELACFYVACSRLRLDTEAVLTSSVLAGLCLAAASQERLHLIEIEGYPQPADFEGCKRAVMTGVTEGLSVMAVDSGHVCRKGPGPCVAFFDERFSFLIASRVP